MPEVWRRSVAEALAVIELLDERIAPLDRELGAAGARRPRVVLLSTIPGIGPVLGLTIAAEIGDVARFASPRKLIGYSGLAPRVKQSGQRSRRASSRSRARARCASPPSRPPRAPGARQPLAPALPDVKARTGKANPAKSAVARKVLIACWHVLSREEPFKRTAPATPTLSRPAPAPFWPPDGPHAN